MKIELVFRNALVKQNGYTMDELNCSIKESFAIEGFPCVSAEALLAFIGRGNKEDSVRLGTLYHLALERT